MYYEILFVEDGLYYVNYYENGCECSAIKLKLSTYEFEEWKAGKIEN